MTVLWQIWKCQSPKTCNYIMQMCSPSTISNTIQYCTEMCSLDDWEIKKGRHWNHYAHWFLKKQTTVDGMTISMLRWPYDIAFSEQMTGLSSLCYQQWMFVLRHSLTPVREGDSPTSWPWWSSMLQKITVIVMILYKTIENNISINQSTQLPSFGDPIPSDIL